MRRLLTALVCAFLTMTAHGETVAVCGASKGHGYYVPKGLVQPKDAGWTEEAISKGSFQLIRAGDDWDIIFSDATGATLSSRADGGKTSAIVTDDGDVVVQIIYGVNVETYIFWLSLNEPMVSFSQAKFGATFPKHSLMVAPCNKWTS